MIRGKVHQILYLGREEGKVMISKMEKVINPIMVKVGDDERFHNVFCEIKYKKGVLSIYGVVGPQKNGDCAGSCGQIQDVVIGKYGTRRFKPGWDMDKVEILVDIWENYHLNDMHPECEHQRALGWRRKCSKRMGFYRPGGDGILGKPCPICGYKYGTEWLRVKLPEWVLEWVLELPESTIIPAWV